MAAEALILVIGIAVWHAAMLSSFGLFSGRYAQTLGLAPKRVVLSRPHLIGILAASAGAAIIVAAQAQGRLGIGILLGGAFVLLDAYLTYSAFRSVRHSTRRRQRES